MSRIIPPLLGSAVGGGGGYVAKAVHFDGGVQLHTDSLSSLDNEFVSCSVWIKAASSLSSILWVVDPLNTFTFNLTLIGPDVNPSLGAEVNLQDSSGNIPPVLRFTSNGGGMDGSWHNFLFTAKTNLNTVDRICKMYLDDVDVTHVTTTDAAAFTMASNGLPFYIGDDTFMEPYIGDIADLWIGPGVSLLTGTDISVADRRKFISASGKPVDPSGFPSAPMLFSGDAATFPINQGSGGPFTLTGTLTNASTSPSD